MTIETILAFFFNDTATTEIYTLSLHDALPIFKGETSSYRDFPVTLYQVQTKYRDEERPRAGILRGREFTMKRSEEHTSELQSRQYLVCRLLLEKKKNMFIPLMKTDRRSTRLTS